MSYISFPDCFGNPAGLDKFSCSYDSPRGRIDVSWQRKKRKVTVTAVIPCGASATFHYPDGRTEELASGTHELSIKL